ncbi:MAG: pentapeptide repeat-containing protein [Pseudomonadota bacterium]
MSDNEDHMLKPLSQRELKDIARKHEMFLGGKPGGARAVVKDRDLTGLNMREMQLQQSDFTGCIMRNSDMTAINFESATLFGCDLSNTVMKNGNFSRTDLRGADIQNADLTDANLSGADLRLGSSVLKRKVKEGGSQYNKDSHAGQVSFSGSTMRNVKLANATAINADFSDAILENVDLRKVDLREAVFKGANLRGANMDGADLRSADFHAATLTGAHMEGTEQSDTNFTLALRDDGAAKAFSEVELTLDELLQKHIQWVGSAGKHGQQMDLSGFDMRKLRSLTGKKLTAITAYETVFADMNLQSCEFQSAKLDKSDFRGCDLRHSDFRGSQLNDSLFVRANLQNANFGALLFKNPNGTERRMPVALNGAILRYADCTGSDFRYASFKDADLTHVNFTDCDLRHANFDGAITADIITDNALLTGTLLEQGDVPLVPEDG